LERRGLYQEVDQIPAGHPTRTIVELYSWQPKEKRLPFYLRFGRSMEQAEIRYYAHFVGTKLARGSPSRTPRIATGRRRRCMAIQAGFFSVSGRYV